MVEAIFKLRGGTWKYKKGERQMKFWRTTLSKTEPLHNERGISQPLASSLDHWSRLCFHPSRAVNSQQTRRAPPPRLPFSRDRRGTVLEACEITKQFDPQRFRIIKVLCEIETKPWSHFIWGSFWHPIHPFVLCFFWTFCWHSICLRHKCLSLSPSCESRFYNSLQPWKFDNPPAKFKATHGFIFGSKILGLFQWHCLYTSFSRCKKNSMLKKKCTNIFIKCPEKK